MLSLDVGCGPGALTLGLARNSALAVGVDVSPAMLRRAAQKAMMGRMRNVYFRLGRAEAIPFPDNYFDAVVSTNMIYELPYPDLVFREMARVAKPGGVVATLNPSEEMSRRKVEESFWRRRLQPNAVNIMRHWATAAEAHHRFSERVLSETLGKLGLTNLDFSGAVDGMLLFAKGTKAPHRSYQGARNRSKEPT